MDPGPEDREPPAPPEPGLFTRMGLLFYGAMAAAAVVWRIGFDGESLWIAPGAGPPDWLGDAAWGLGAGAALLALSALATRFTHTGERLEAALAEQLGPISVPNALLLATASGLAEELFFRGALQPHAGWVLTSVLFGALHFVPRRDLWPWTAMAVLAGGVLGWLFEHTGNLLAPVLAHTLVNGVNLPLLARRARETPAA